jgi:hypothetical protein
MEQTYAVAFELLIYTNGIGLMYGGNELIIQI